MSQEKIGVDRVAKIKEQPHAKNAVFLYDKRTKTIRLASERNFALGNKSGKGLKQGHQAVFRRILDQKISEDQILTINKSSISNKGKKCLDIIGGVSKEMAVLQWWACQSTKASQKFARVDKLKEKVTPDFFKQRFLIKLAAKGDRNLYLSKEKIGNEFVVKLGKKPNNWRSWFIMDKRSNTVRLFTQPHLALSNQSGKGVKPGANIVMRAYDPKDASQPIQIKGKKIANAKSKRCLSTANNENKDNINVNFWMCIDKETQKWERVAVPGSYEELCKDVTRKGERYRVCPGKKDQHLGHHCVRTVILKAGTETLVKKCGKETWEIAKCNRYQQKGQWFRQCGEDHLEQVEDGGAINVDN